MANGSNKVVKRTATTNEYEYIECIECIECIGCIECGERNTGHVAGAKRGDRGLGGSREMELKKSQMCELLLIARVC